MFDNFIVFLCTIMIVSAPLAFSAGSNAYEENIVTLRDAAEKGDAKAQNNLGLAYARGAGVQKDYVQAFMWFHLAVMISKDETLRKEATQDEKLVAESMTSAQIAQGKLMAAEWLKQNQSPTP